MGKNWIPTVGGLVLAIGMSLQAVEGYPKVKFIGLIMAAVGGGVGLWAAKQFNVTGGSIPQASPPGVALKSDAMGVVDAVDVLEKQGSPIGNRAYIAKQTAQAIIAAPVSPAEVTLKQ
jgi:hypothetical protein